MDSLWATEFYKASLRFDARSIPAARSAPVVFDVSFRHRAQALRRGVAHLHEGLPNLEARRGPGAGFIPLGFDSQVPYL